MNEIKTAISKLIYLRHDENTRDHELLTAIDELETALTASADSVQERERLEEALSGVLERHTQLSTDALDEVVPKLADVALAADANLRLTKGEQEPVARVNHAFDRGVDWITDYTRIQEGTRLYTAPQAQQEAGNDAQDAARYRWLRSPERGMSNLTTVISDDYQPPYFELKCGEELDAAIDAAMQASPAQAEADEATFNVWQGGMIVASASGPREDALREANHYAVVYGQDGPVEVKEAEAQQSKGER